MADNKFTFWENMKKAIDVQTDPVYKCKCYEALINYGLYKKLPENDGTQESLNLISFCMSFTNTLQKNWDYEEQKSEEGKVGGSKQKYSDDELIAVIRAIGIEKMGGSPTTKELESKSEQMYGNHISEKTFSRRGYNKAARDKIAKEAYEENENDKPQTQIESWTF